MSLLNDMLHDLAKQKIVEEKIPLLSPAITRYAEGIIKKILLGGLVAGLMLTSVLLFNKQSAAPAEEKTSQPIEQNTDSLPARTSTGPAPLPTVSYVEPLGALAPLKTEPVSANSAEAELLSEDLADTGSETGDELATVVNKVYSPQTLEEWHDAQLNKALDAMEDGFDNKAIELLQAILIKVPDSRDARQNLASIYLTNNDYLQASKVINEGLLYAPADPMLLAVKGRLLIDQGKALDAIKLLMRHRPAIADHPDFYATLAAALQSEGRIVEAGSLYKALLQVEPENGLYWLGYAIALENSHKANQAVEAYQRASQYPDTDSDVRDYAEGRLKVLQG